MKKIFILLFAILLLAACSDEGEATENTGEENTDNTTENETDADTSEEAEQKKSIKSGKQQ